MVRIRYNEAMRRQAVAKQKRREEEMILKTIVDMQLADKQTKRMENALDKSTKEIRRTLRGDDKHKKYESTRDTSFDRYTDGDDNWD